VRLVIGSCYWFLYVGERTRGLPLLQGNISAPLQHVINCILTWEKLKNLLFWKLMFSGRNLEAALILQPPQFAICAPALTPVKPASAYLNTQHPGI
jgi:hypothetical protein